MNSKHTTNLTNTPLDVRFKLSALWVALMFIYIYVDHFDLYTTGDLENIIAGKMGPFAITQSSLLQAMLLMMIPSLMIFLCIVLKPKPNRWTNIAVAILYIAVCVANIIGETWYFYIFATAIEIILLALIVRYAWTWPRTVQ